MRDTKRITKVLQILEFVWKKHPDLRLGQLLMNSVTKIGMANHNKDDLYYYEDEELIQVVQQTYLNKIEYFLCEGKVHSDDKGESKV